MVVGSARDTWELLVAEQAELAVLGSSIAVLSWDAETYMPKSAQAHRAKQRAMLSGIVHERATAPKIGEWLAELAESELINDDEVAVTVRELRRSYDKSTKMPLEMVKEMAEVTSLATHAWEEARDTNNFKLFLPHLKKVVELVKQCTEIMGYRNEPYDALLDDYEQDLLTSDVADEFASLRPALVEMLDKIKGASKQADEGITRRSYPVAAQREFVSAVSAAIGFNFEHGRLDVTAHPFCTRLGPDDVRITVRYDENFFNSAFFGTMHESGHGMYEQGLPREKWGTPLGSAVSMGVHESQSRTWENSVCRSAAFWQHFYPQAQVQFKDTLHDVSVDDFVFAINAVKPDFIRVEADELTYNLHVMIRFEIELALFRGELEVEDIPQAWNDKYKEYLGVTVKNDAQGCLQDIHWSHGAFGYFPTYTLGNMFAAQFMEQAYKDIDSLDAQFATGNFKSLQEWLTNNVYVHGQRYSSMDLVKHVTGKPLSSSPMLDSLKNKLYPLYDIS